MSYGEELATHTSLESCVNVSNNFGEALTRESAGLYLSSSGVVIGVSLVSLL